MEQAEMNLPEFKAWFEGFTEGMDAAPTEKQWKRITARVKEISGTPTSYPVFVHRYREYRPFWPTAGTPALTCASTAASVGVQLRNEARGVSGGISASEPFEIHAAMFEVGRAEASASA